MRSLPPALPLQTASSALSPPWKTTFFLTAVLTQMFQKTFCVFLVLLRQHRTVQEIREKYVSNPSGTPDAPVERNRHAVCRFHLRNKPCQVSCRSGGYRKPGIRILYDTVPVQQIRSRRDQLPISSVPAICQLQFFTSVVHILHLCADKQRLRRNRDDAALVVNIPDTVFIQNPVPGDNHPRGNYSRQGKEFVLPDCRVHPGCRCQLPFHSRLEISDADFLWYCLTDPGITEHIVLIGSGGKLPCVP